MINALKSASPKLRPSGRSALLAIFAVDAEPEPVETPDFGEKLQQISDLAVHQRPSRYDPALPEHHVKA